MVLRIAYKATKAGAVQLTLPLSKSIEARRMIIQALHGETPKTDIKACDDLRLLSLALHGYLRRESELYLGLSGTALRFLTALCAVTPGYHVRLTGDEGLSRRPIAPLTAQLRNMGAEIKEDFAPVEILGARLHGSRADIDALLAANSSQYLSALMLASPLMAEPLPRFSIPNGTVSAPYLHMTRRILAGDLGAEADWSAASYFFLATLLTGRDTLLSPPLPPPSKSKQGDARCAEYFSRLGISTDFADNCTRLSREGDISIPSSLDLSSEPDLVPALSVACGYLGIHTRLTGIAHIRVKESDRLDSVTAALNAVGIRACHDTDSITIRGRNKVNSIAVIDCSGDHRIAMAFAPCAAFLPEGLTLLGGECVSKSFPDYFASLRGYGYNITPCKEP